MRLGLLGGTFDPPHVGHLLVASDACDELALDRLVFVPNARQPLKGDRDVTPAADRLAMLQLATAGDVRFEVDPIEIERGGTSYSVETLAEYAGRFPGATRYFLVGADVGGSFGHWREPRRVASLARLAILRRGTGTDAAGDAAALAPFLQVVGDAAEPPIVVHTRRIDVSSTEVRQRVRSGRPLTGFVPAAVARFIAEHGLYQPGHHP